jgi:hypothetical protein
MRNVDIDKLIVVQAGRWGKAGKWWHEKVPGLPGSGYITRKFTEKFDPEFAEKMEVLREIDDDIYDWVQEVKEDLKNIRNYFSNHKLGAVAALLASIDSKFRRIEDHQHELDNMYENDLGEITEGFDDLRQWHEKAVKAGKTPDEIVKISGWLEDIGKYFSREKMSRRERREKNNAIKGLIGLTDRVVGSIESYLSEMGSQRKSGEIGNYLDNLNKIISQQQKFQNQFMTVYNRYLKDDMAAAFKANEDKIESQQQSEKSETPSAGKASPKTIEENIERTFPEQPEDVDIKELAEGLKKSRIQINPGDVVESVKQEELPAIKLKEKDVEIVESKINTINLLIKEAQEEKIYGASDVQNWTERLMQLSSEIGGYLEQMYGVSVPTSRFTEMEGIEDVMSPTTTTVPIQEEPSTQIEGRLPIPRINIDPSEKQIVDPAFSKALPSAGLPDFGEEDIEEPPMTLRSPTLEEKKSNHKKFINILDKVSTLGNNYLTASIILKYAKIIDPYDVDESLKLTAIAEGILNV